MLLIRKLDRKRWECTASTGLRCTTVGNARYDRYSFQGKRSSHLADPRKQTASDSYNANLDETFTSPHRKPVSADRYRRRPPRDELSQSSSSLATESQCPPTDNNNGTLAAGVGSLICIYPSLDCFYFASLEFPNPHRVPKFQFNNHYPKFSTHQVTGDVSGSTTVRNRIPVRVITGISVTLAVVALCFVVFLFLQVRSRRCAARIGTIEIDQQARAISPFTLITEIGAVNNDSPSDTRRTGALQEKMLDLEAIERPSNRGSPEVHAELQAAKAQINVVVERMNAL
ncbi:hypothetical protein B0H13DRAFT_1853828 [Mycena leptocephala]|nr:hypothetical protein B0H13DRAFT_1853828 [Mycena leptocephala]